MLEIGELKPIPQTNIFYPLRNLLQSLYFRFLPPDMSPSSKPDLGILEKKGWHEEGKRYKLIEDIAKGGFATIYLGKDEKLDRLVAIKYSPLKDSNDHQLYAEAVVTGRLDQHPKIIRILDYSETKIGEEKFAVIVMEYLNPQTHPNLQQLLAPDLLKSLQEKK
ncbi:hypothetical protein GYA19_02935 [Candidatus Beckwithbacteria bacterium]|nr:hypothetical protein [Candidatus Beckwithbacteria bacterium]